MKSVNNSVRGKNRGRNSIICIEEARKHSVFRLLSKRRRRDSNYALSSCLMLARPEKSLFSMLFNVILFISSLSIPAFIILLGVKLGVYIGVKWMVLL